MFTLNYFILSTNLDTIIIKVISNIIIVTWQRKVNIIYLIIYKFNICLYNII